jgi:predicted nucleic acid-binding protein
VEGRDDLTISDLAVTEVMSALARRLREGTVAPDAVRRMHRAITGALDDGLYVRVELTRETHRRAEHYLVTLSATRLRASDALHLALAMSARAASVASFDLRLATAARALGLATYPP